MDEAGNESGFTDPSPSTTTFANTPENISVAEVFYSSASLIWSGSGNPSYTRWSILVSTDGFISSTGTLKSFGDGYTSTVYTAENLDRGSSYSWKVAAVNREGIMTEYSITVSTRIPGWPSLNNPPAGHITASTGITFGWDTLPDALEYRFGISTSPGMSPLHLSSTTALPQVEIFVDEGLYYWSVQTNYDNSGFSEWAPPRRITVDTTPPRNVSIQELRFLSPSEISASGYAEDILSGLHDTPYSFAVSTDDINFSTSPWVSSAYNWPALGLNTTYWFRIRARDMAGNISAWSGSVSTMTFRQTAYLDQPYSFVYLDGTEEVSRVTVSGNAFSIWTYGEVLPLTQAQASAVSRADSLLPEGTNELSEPVYYRINTGHGREVDYSMAEPGSITVRFYYPGDLASPDIDRLRILRLNPQNEEWEILEPFILDRSERYIQITLSGLSVFKLSILPYTGLESLHIYPNPFKPGDPLHGGARGGEGIIIGGLPETAEIKIFDISGSLVEKLEHRGGSILRWEKAEDTSTGVYICLVTSEDGRTKTVKFSIIR